MLKPPLGPCDSYQLEPEVATRFWSKVNILGEEDCWLWFGALSASGYGSFGWHKKMCGAHRVAAYLAGIIASPVWEFSTTDRTLILHTCDTPLCCNPKHLYAGNFTDNNQDRADRDRVNYSRGTDHYWSQFTDEEVRKIRQLFTHSQPSYASVGRQYGVSSNAIRKIALGLSYSHIQ